MVVYILLFLTAFIVTLCMFFFSAVLTLLSAPITPPVQPIKFTADHPFVYYIKYGDILLFAGKTYNP